MPRSSLCEVPRILISAPFSMDHLLMTQQSLGSIAVRPAKRRTGHGHARRSHRVISSEGLHLAVLRATPSVTEHQLAGESASCKNPELSLETVPSRYLRCAGGTPAPQSRHEGFLVVRASRPHVLIRFVRRRVNSILNFAGGWNLSYLLVALLFCPAQRRFPIRTFGVDMAGVAGY